MKKKSTFISLAVSMLLFASCQKQPDEQLTPVATTSRIKTYSESVVTPNGNSGTTFSITYDNSGRITAITSTTSPGDKFVYAFPSANRYTMDVYRGGVVTIHEDFFLNGSSLVDSTIQYNNTKDTMTEGHLYNAANQVTRIREYDYTKATGAVMYNTTNYTYDAAGNLVKSEDRFGEVHTYTYYTNLSYFPPVTIGPVTAASTKKLNLVKTHTLTSNGTVLGSAELSYNFDVSGRLIQERTQLNNGTVVVKTYEYL